MKNYENETTYTDIYLKLVGQELLTKCSSSLYYCNSEGDKLFRASNHLPNIENVVFFDSENETKTTNMLLLLDFSDNYEMEGKSDQEISRLTDKFCEKMSDKYNIDIEYYIMDDQFDEGHFFMIAERFFKN